MNNSVITSVSPRECELIASGRQTMLVRKTRPKIETPFKCYIYCTKGTFDITDCPDLSKDSVKKVAEGRGKVIGSFVCDEIIEDKHGEYADVFYKDGLLTLEEQKKYGKNKPLYGWHISDLKIYNKPKELGEFGNYKTEWIQWYHSDDKVFYPLKRMSGSWCYIEEE